MDLTIVAGATLAAFAAHLIEIAVWEWCSIDFDGYVSARGGRAGVET
jgi:hypothetical protein